MHIAMTRIGIYFFTCFLLNLGVSAQVNTTSSFLNVDIDILEEFCNLNMHELDIKMKEYGYVKISNSDKEWIEYSKGSIDVALHVVSYNANLGTYTFSWLDQFSKSSPHAELMRQLRTLKYKDKADGVVYILPSLKGGFMITSYQDELLKRSTIIMQVNK